jgi:hypothetical protein
MTQMPEDKLDRGFTALDLRLDMIEKKFAGLHEGLQLILNKVAAIERRLSTMEEKLPKT